MTEVDHISTAWVERKVLDALDQLDCRLDIQDRLAEVELKLEAIFRAGDQNVAVRQEGVEQTKELVAMINGLSERIETLKAATCVLVKALGMEPPGWGSGEGRKPS